MEHDDERPPVYDEGVRPAAAAAAGPKILATQARAHPVCLSVRRNFFAKSGPEFSYTTHFTGEGGPSIPTYLHI